MRSIRFALILCILSITAPLVMAEDGKVLYSRWTPAAIYTDGQTSTTLEVWTKGQITSISVYIGFGETGQLRDDGQGGDRVAGDGIWTISGLTRFLKQYSIPNAGPYGYTLTVKTGGKEETAHPASLGLTEQTNQKITKVAKDVYRGKWAAFLVDKKGELFDGKFPICNVRCGKGNEKVFQTFYKYFPDKFDYLVVMPFAPIYHPDDYGENKPYFVPVRNTIKNIGLEIFDDGNKFGSKKKLKGIIFHSFGYGAILDHEIGHAWGVRIMEALGSQYSSGWHISPYANQVGQMAHNPQLKLKKNSDGSYKATIVNDQEKDHPYAPLTLYLMGLIPPEDVPPVMILRNTNRPNFNKIPKSEFDIFTIQQIMAANGGERIPAYPNTQKKFRVGFIFVSDRELTQAEYDYCSAIPQYFQSKDEGMSYLTPFHHATGGRAKIRNKMAKPLKK